MNNNEKLNKILSIINDIKEDHQYYDFEYRVIYQDKDRQIKNLHDAFMVLRQNNNILREAINSICFTIVDSVHDDEIDVLNCKEPCVITKLTQENERLKKINEDQFKSYKLLSEDRDGILDRSNNLYRDNHDLKLENAKLKEKNEKDKPFCVIPIEGKARFFEKLSDKYANEITELKKINQELKNRCVSNAHISYDCDQLRKHIDNLQDNIEELKKKNEESGKENFICHLEINNTGHIYDKLVKEHKELIKEIEELKKDNERKSVMARLNESHNKGVESYKQYFIDECERYGEENVKLKKENEELKTYYESIDERSCYYSNKAKKLENENKELKVEMQELRLSNENKSVMSGINKLDYNEKIERLLKENESLKDSLHTLRGKIYNLGGTHEDCRYE